MKNPLNFAYARVLVTGGAGFIGSALVHELNRRGCHQIVIADRLRSSEKWRNLVPLRFEEYVEADDLLSRLELGDLGRFDLILHLGACSSTTETDAAFLYRNNFEFSRALAEFALNNRQGTRFVYASSAATYGDGTRGMSDADPSVDALMRLRPLNMYGYSKQLFDLWAARTGVLGKITGLKYFNIYGPNEAHKGDMRSLVARSVPTILETGSMQLFRSHHPDYRDGEQRRDFLYIRDAVDMTLHLAAHPNARGLFNIGSGSAVTWLEVANALFRALDRTPNIEFIPMPEYLRPKYQYFTRADIGRLRATGYTAPVTPLADAVSDYVRNFILPDLRLGDRGEA
jgi:ADP-L-glycero-D-manno-heptose 6-epimerase